MVLFIGEKMHMAAREPWKGRTLSRVSHQGRGEETTVSGPRLTFWIPRYQHIGLGETGPPHLLVPAAAHTASASA